MSTLAFERGTAQIRDQIRYAYLVEDMIAKAAERLGQRLPACRATRSAPASRSLRADMAAARAMTYMVVSRGDAVASGIRGLAHARHGRRDSAARAAAGARHPRSLRPRKSGRRRLGLFLPARPFPSPSRPVPRKSNATSSASGYWGCRDEYRPPARLTMNLLPTAEQREIVRFSEELSQRACARFASTASRLADRQFRSCAVSRSRGSWYLGLRSAGSGRRRRPVWRPRRCLIFRELGRHLLSPAIFALTLGAHLVSQFDQSCCRVSSMAAHASESPMRAAASHWRSEATAKFICSTAPTPNGCSSSAPRTAWRCSIETKFAEIQPVSKHRQSPHLAPCPTRGCEPVVLRPLRDDRPLHERALLFLSAFRRRDCGGYPGHGRRVCQDARAIRPADRLLPGHQAYLRRYGHPLRGRRVPNGVRFARCSPKDTHGRHSTRHRPNWSPPHRRSRTPPRTFKSTARSDSPPKPTRICS